MEVKSSVNEGFDKLKLNPYRMQRTYFKTSKYTLSLFIPPAETTVVQAGYNVSIMGILYFQLPWRDGPSKRSLEIRVRNQRKILRCIGEALNWFDTIEDLFVTKDNILYFNTKYNDLVVRYISDPDDTPQGLKIVPVVIDNDNGTKEEGAIVTVNNMENFIQLTRNELQELFDVLYNFNFANEILLTIGALELSRLSDRFGTQSHNFNNKFLR